MNGDELARRAAPTIVALGGAFMLDPATIARGQELGLDLAGFYGLGRGSVLGDVDASVVAASFPFIDAGLVRAVWEGARQVMAPSDAASQYAAVCHLWGRAHLDRVEGLDRLGDLLESVVTAGSVVLNPLFAGWRAVTLPADGPARVAQLLFVAREQRGGPHVAALLNCGLSPLEAVLVSGGPDAAALYGWPAPYPDPEPLRAAHTAAIEMTDRIVGPAYDVLDNAEGEQLLALLNAAESSGTRPLTFLVGPEQR